VTKPSASPSREIRSGWKFSSKKARALAPSETSALFAARQGSRNELPSALLSTAGFCCAAIGLQLMRNAVKACR
jgi:hypothetical protein